MEIKENANPMEQMMQGGGMGGPPNGRGGAPGGGGGAPGGGPR